jgi:hypothetical protein
LSWHKEEGAVSRPLGKRKSPSAVYLDLIHNLLNVGDVGGEALGFSFLS